MPTTQEGERRLQLIQLNDLESDAATEMLGLGVEQARSRLSSLSSAPLKIVARPVDMLPAGDITELLTVTDDQYFVLSQKIGGHLAASFSMMLPRSSARTVIRSLRNDRYTRGRLKPSEYEALTEVGSTVVNGCVRALCEGMSLELTTAMPHGFKASSDELFAKVSYYGPVQWGMISSLQFQIDNKKHEAYLLLALQTQHAKELKRAISLSLGAFVESLVGMAG